MANGPLAKRITSGFGFGFFYPRTIAMPQKNEKDLEELSEHIKEGMEFRFVQRMDEVVKIALA